MKNKHSIKALTLIVMLLSCNKEPRSSLFQHSENNPYNIFDLKKSHFNYKGNEIFTINYPQSLLNTNFLYYNYLLLEGERLSTISIKDDCKAIYEHKGYKIHKDIISFAGFEECDLYIVPFLDFSLKQGDTLKYHFQWTRLDNKVYDKTVKDTLYKFRRYNGIGTENENNTVILATKNIGIVGIYDTSLIYKKIKETPIGYNHKLNSYPINKIALRKPMLNLELIDEFKHD